MDILISKENGILTITFNRPGKKNAITAAMYQTIADALKDAENDAEVRVILFTGKPEIFTAGNDLDDFLQNPPREHQKPCVSIYTESQPCHQTGSRGGFRSRSRHRHDAIAALRFCLCGGQCQIFTAVRKARACVRNLLPVFYCRK